MHSQMVHLMLGCFIFRTMCQHLVLDGVTDGKWHCLQPVKWDISSPSLGKPCFIWTVKVVFLTILVVEDVVGQIRNALWVSPHVHADLPGKVRRWTIPNKDQT